jgi:mono/diheme cytochrome c family protein
VGPEKGKGPAAPEREKGKGDAGAETEVAGKATGGKRKNRPRGERTRKEQYRAAWAKWYTEHRAERIAKAKAQREADPEHYKEIQRKYRMKHRKQKG